MLDSVSREIRADYASSGNPTHWPSDPKKQPDVIDFFIVKNLALNSITFGEIDIKSSLNSDHSPINVDLSTSVFMKETINKLTNKKTEWKGFRNDLNAHILLKSKLEVTEDIDREVNLLTQQIVTAARRNTPVTKRAAFAPKIPHELLNLIGEARNLRKEWQKN